MSEPVHHLVVELFLSSELLAEGLDLASALLDRVVRPGKQLPVRVLRVDLLPHLNSHDWHHFINFGAFVLIFLRLSKRHLFVLRGCINNLRAFFVVIARVIHGDSFLNGLLGRFKEPFSLSFNLLLQRSRLAQLVDDELVKELVSAILLGQVLQLVLVPWQASLLENLERSVSQSSLRGVLLRRVVGLDESLEDGHLHELLLSFVWRLINPGGLLGCSSLLLKYERL